MKLVAEDKMANVNVTVEKVRQYCRLVAQEKEKKAKTTSRNKPGFDAELFNETSYHKLNGLRYVHPYYFTFKTYCKRRWVGRPLLEVFKEEFRSETPEYYEKAIKSGKITVNGMVASSDLILKDNDVIRNKVHRHEPPVTAQPLEFIESNEDLVVLNKPPSIPVHPCGRYRHNTIVFLLGKEHNLTNLYTIHRIDRLTSGVLMFARTLKKAQELEAQVREREIEKAYLCRVAGEFPGGTVDCAESITVVSHKVGICRVSPDGKPCRTVFTKISFNGHSSLLRCVPHTGRMHQIRVHLQWLGFPITNDPIYNHEAWGRERGKGGVTDEMVHKVMAAMEKSPTVIRGSEESYRSSSIEQPTGTTSPRAEDKPAVSSGSNFRAEDFGSGTKLLSRGEAGDSDSRLSSVGAGDSVTSEHTSSDGSAPGGDVRDSESRLASVGAGDSVASEHTSSDGSAPGGEVRDSESRLASVGAGDSVASEHTSSDGSAPGLSCVQYDAECSECRITRRDPSPAELTMYLHALSYKGPDWEYRTNLPKWAVSDWED